MNNQPPVIDAYSRWDGGIADYPKESQKNEYGHGRSVNFRTDPRKLTLLPQTVKESGSVITDLPVAGDRVGTDVYVYGNTGNIYKRTSAGSVSLLRSVASSHGNGMRYYGEDDFLYYPRDKTIGRYGQMGGTPTFVDDFLGSEGGVPLNTYALDLEAGSSEFASRADTASLSITGDLSIECSIKPESLPTSGNSMVLFSKWDVNSNLRSYKLEIYAASGYFGDGSAGALTISSNTTEAPIDSACTGTIGAYTLSATNASFAAGQQVLIHQTQGTGAGTQQKNKIVSYSTGTITLETALNASYISGAQVRVLPQYTDVTINSGVTYSAKTWDGTVGGILAFLATGTVTTTGSISASGKGFRGGTNLSDGADGRQGEGVTGNPQSANIAANENGGGGGQQGAGGGGGGHASSGSNGGVVGNYGRGGGTAGTADLTTVVFGGGGGSSADGTNGGNGARGGGYIFIAGTTLVVSGSIVSAGSTGSNGNSGDFAGGGGGGAGGSILLKAQTATLGTTLITASGGAGGSAGSGSATAGGAGSVGRIHLDYYTSYTGTTTPTLDVLQDNSLVTNTTYQLRLGLSSNGTAEEFLTKSTTITTAQKFHVGASWDASDMQAEFFQDGVSLGTSQGAVSSLNNNASVAGLGADFNSTARNFFDGIIDEVRIWNTERTAAQMLANKGVQIATNSAGLVAYYQLNGNWDDSTSNANHLTTTGGTFTTDVPFSSPTARLDLDQYLDTSGDTYALGTSISETSANKQTFVPDKDPQKSIEVNINDTGDDSDWTITVHDSLNRVVASKTVTHANLVTGDFEFVFDEVWRPIRGASYHFHITATTTTGAPKIVSTGSNDLETADFHTYYQFLVEDEYHPAERMLNILAVGNERYLATYDAAGTYNPHRLVLPSGWRIRSLTIWKGYLAIGCWRGTNIYDTDEGMVFLWDGYATTYNDAIPIPEGGINAMESSRGILYLQAGYHGDLLAYRGGDYAEVIKRVPKIADDEYIETYPNALCMWDALLRWGVGGVSNAATVERGVYTHGRRKPSSPESLSYDYPISTESRGTTVRIGFLFPVDRKLLIGWKDNVSYGLDVADPTAAPFGTGTVEQTVNAYGRVSKEKHVTMVRADFEPLRSGESMKVKYRKDRDDEWTEGAVESTVGETFTRLEIPFGNVREVEIACDLATSVSTSPALLELGLEVDPKTSERAF